MVLTLEQVDLLPSEELRPLVKKLLAEFDALLKRVADLEAENERLKQRLDKSANSRNSSQPPSRDQKTNQPEKKRRKHGPPFGHQKFSRLLVDNPDRVIQVPVTECDHCLAEVMGQLAVKVWVCDCYGAQLKAPAEVFQLCLAHQLRDLQRILNSSPEGLWAKAAQKLFRDAIHLRNRFSSGEMKLAGFMRRVAQIENHLDRLLEEELKNEAARKLQNRFSTHHGKLLTFLHYPGVPPTNNESAAGAARERDPPQSDQRLPLRMGSESLRRAADDHRYCQTKRRADLSNVSGSIAESGS